MTNIRLTVLSDSAADIRGKIHYSGPDTVFCRGSGSDNYVCGRCGSILLQGVDSLRFESGAIKCNSCAEYNDIARPARHPVLPPMLKDVVALAPAQLRDWVDEKWEISPHTVEIRRLRTEFNDDWMREQGEAPRQIFHYTTSQGLRGIVNSHQLWATDIAYMNDATEMEYGLGLVGKQISRVVAATTDLERELLRRADVSGSPLTLRGDFVACFCADGDLLSQWRSYAASGSGYAIGFNTGSLVAHNQPILRRVIYDEVVQKCLIESIISKSCGLFRQVAAGRSIKELDEDRTLTAFASFLASRLKEFVFTFKHAGFREEKEWRLIFRGFRSIEYMPAVQFRGDELSTPYIPITLRSASPSPPILPILEVRHGPNIHPGLARKSLLLMLEKFGYDHVEVRGSKTPLRR